MRERSGEGSGFFCLFCGCRKEMSLVFGVDFFSCVVVVFFVVSEYGLDVIMELYFSDFRGVVFGVNVVKWSI